MPRASTNSMEDTDEAIHLVGFEWVGQQHLAQALMEQALNAAGARRAKFAPAVPAPEALVSKRKKDSVSKEPANEKKKLKMCVCEQMCSEMHCKNMQKPYKHMSGSCGKGHPGSQEGQKLCCGYGCIS